METDDSWKAMATFWEKIKKEDVSFVLLFSSKKTGAASQIEYACSQNMQELAVDEEVRAKFLKACEKPKQIKELKKLKDLLQDDLQHYKQAVGQHKAVNDMIPHNIIQPCLPSREERCFDYGDLPGEIRYDGMQCLFYSKISESQFPELLKLPAPMYPGEVGERKNGLATIPNSSMTTDMKAQAMPATTTKSKTGTEVPRMLFFGGTVQHENTSKNEVPTATTISSMGRLSNTKPLDAKAKNTCPIPSYIKKPPGTSTSIGPATYPDGGMADKMPGEPRTKSAKPFLERSNGKILRFIQAVNGWKCKSSRKKMIFLHDLEKDGAKIVKVNWAHRISEKIWKAMQRPNVIYDGSKVKDLLRFIRNMYVHYQQLSEDVKTSLRKDQDKVLDYFTVRFPMLLYHTYSVMEQFSEEEDFRPYY